MACWALGLGCSVRGAIGQGGDAGVTDSGLADAGFTDGGEGDAGSVDAGLSDSGPVDAGSSDAGPADDGGADGGPTDAGPPSVALNPADSLTQGMIFCVPYAFGPAVPLRDYAGDLPVTVSNQDAGAYAWAAADSTWPWPNRLWALDTYPNATIASALILQNLTDPWYSAGSPSSQGMAYAQILQPANTTSGLTRACDTNYGAPFTIYTNHVAGMFTTTLMNASNQTILPEPSQHWAFPTSPSIPWTMNLVNIVADGGAIVYSNFTATAQLPAGQMVVSATNPQADPYYQWREGGTIAQSVIDVVALTGSTNNTHVYGGNFEGKVALQVAWKRSLTDTEIQRFTADPLAIFDFANIPQPP